MNVSNHNAKWGEFYQGETWISCNIDWKCSSNLSLMSISSYVVRSTEETGNIYSVRNKIWDEYLANSLLERGIFVTNTCMLVIKQAPMAFRHII